MVENNKMTNIERLKSGIKELRDDLNLTWHNSDLEQFDLKLREYENLIRQITRMEIFVYNLYQLKSSKQLCQTEMSKIYEIIEELRDKTESVHFFKMEKYNKILKETQEEKEKKIKCHICRKIIKNDESYFPMKYKGKQRYYHHYCWHNGK